jgi:branched-chain amino acid transport system permease protein
MRFLFKTDYNQDIRLAKHGGHVFWYGLLCLLLVAAPWLVQEYWLAQLTFVLIYAIVGLGLMLLAGFTGLFSLGHAAFLGVGAYTQAVMVNAGVPFPIALACAGLLSAAVGMVVGLPALRVKGIYLGMATLAFGFIVEEGMARWESVTGGNSGLMVKLPQPVRLGLDSSNEFYFLCLVVTGRHAGHRQPDALVHRPRLRGHSRFGNLGAEHGHPPGALQDLSFALSAALAGMGGALYAHKIQFLSPDQFSLLQSIDLLLMVVIGGLGSIHGAFLGAIFLIVMPQLIAWARTSCPR